MRDRLIQLEAGCRGRLDLHFPDLRHTGLTNAAVAGATMAELMALAGYSTPGAAMRYQRAAADRLQDLAKRLSAITQSESDTRRGRPCEGSVTSRAGLATVTERG